MIQSIESRVTASLEEISRRKTHLVGVSGGRDSTVLLHLLAAHGFKKLVVCHLDHGLRGEAARADARFVRRIALREGLEFVGQRTDVASEAALQRVSVETAGREARYRFFAEVAKERRCRTIFLGHHADDRVETFLFNLLRGTGRTGLSGMRPAAERRISGTRMLLLRPLLAVWRSELDAYATHHRLRFREDATNLDVSSQRNNLRHQIIPGISKMFRRDVRASLWRAAEILTAEDDWMAGQIGVPDRVLSVGLLRKQHVAAQRRLIHGWLTQQHVASVGFEEVERVRGLLSHESPAKVNLPEGRFARRRAGVLFLDGEG